MLRVRKGRGRRYSVKEVEVGNRRRTALPLWNTGGARWSPRYAGVLVPAVLVEQYKRQKGFPFWGGGGLISKIVRKPLATAGRGYVDNDGSKEIFGTRVWLAVVVDIS